MIETHSSNTYELVGGPGCGLVIELPENHSSDTFEYDYERIDKMHKVHKFSCQYMKSADDSYKATYVPGT